MDLLLYLVTDEFVKQKKRFFSILRQAIDGGVTVVQLRQKGMKRKSLLALAQQLQEEVLVPKNTPLIINDDPFLAKECGAAGVHLGQSDSSPEHARDLLGSTKVIGLSVETREQALAANDLPIDYIGASPLFSTATKEDHGTPWGLNGLRWLCKNSVHPVVAIGGISLSCVRGVMDAGAKGIAVVSAIWQSRDPQKAAKDLLEIGDHYRRCL